MKLRLAVALSFAALLVPMCAFAFDTTRPARVTNLAIDGLGPHTAVLTWTESGDDSMTGQAVNFQVRYSTSPITEANWNSAQVFCARDAGSPGSNTCCGDGNFVLNPSTTYYFAIRYWDEVDNESILSNVPSGTTPTAIPQHAEVAC